MKRILTLTLCLGLLWSNAPAFADVNIGKGEDGEVTTITGNGTPSQGSYTVEGPRNIAVSKGLVYFIDGTHEKAKLRVWDGKSNKTYVNLAGDEVAARGGKTFVSTGLAVVDGDVLVSSHRDLYLVKSSKSSKYLTRLSKLRDYMDKNGYDYIYRMETYGKDLYFMLAHKSRGYGFVKYNIKSKEITVVLNPKVYDTGPNNFYVDKEGILIAFQSGVLGYEKFFPRASIAAIESNEGAFVDMWMGKDNYVYYVMNEDRSKWKIYKRHRSNVEDLTLLAGDRLGYNDGFLDQVEMDGATDFVWDGSGYIFADKGNHAIRKIWLDTAPSNTVY